MVSEELKKKVEELRQNSYEFRSVFDEATQKIENQIIEKTNKMNNSRSFHPVKPSGFNIWVKVDAYTLTYEEFECLREYLEK